MTLSGVLQDALSEWTPGAMTGPNWVETAQDLFDASERRAKRGVAFDDSQDGLHYRAYLRAIVQRNEAQATHLARKYLGARKAREDLVSESGKGSSSRPYAVGEDKSYDGAAMSAVDQRLGIVEAKGGTGASADVVRRVLSPAVANLEKYLSGDDSRAIQAGFAMVLSAMALALDQIDATDAAKHVRAANSSLKAKS